METFEGVPHNVKTLAFAGLVGTTTTGGKISNLQALYQGTTGHY